MSDAKYYAARQEVRAEGVRGVLDALRDDLLGRLRELVRNVTVLLILFFGALLAVGWIVQDTHTKVAGYEQRISAMQTVVAAPVFALTATPTVDTSIAEAISRAQIRNDVARLTGDQAVWDEIHRLRNEANDLRNQKAWLQDIVLTSEKQIGELRREVFKGGEYTPMGLRWAIVANSLGWKVATRGDIGMLFKYYFPGEEPVMIDTLSGYNILNGSTGNFLIWAATNSTTDRGEFYLVKGAKLDQTAWRRGGIVTKTFTDAVGMDYELSQKSGIKFTIPSDWWPLSEDEYTSLLNFVNEWPISK